MNRDMNIDQARTIVSHITNQRKRWGLQYTGDEYTQHQIMDAIVLINGALSNVQENLVPKDDLSKANRQIGAAKSREANLRKQLSQVEDALSNANEELRQLQK